MFAAFRTLEVVHSSESTVVYATVYTVFFHRGIPLISENLGCRGKLDSTICRYGKMSVCTHGVDGCSLDFSSA
ncbi:MAG: hypothetical protein CSA33_07760 [Desulfobulbus propionicus]|nr:MAG: hypothetical protein CSA33_07760 [Desulfobulbus propionicus]